MLKPKRTEYPKMTPEERAAFENTVAAEMASKDENLAAAREVLPRLRDDCAWAAGVVRTLREAREAAGVSLAQIEAQTGIHKSALSRLENSKAPNPTLAFLRRYAQALGMELAISIKSNDGKCT